MKNVIKIFLLILLIIFIAILYIDYRDNRYINNIEKKIIKYTDIKKIDYLNVYNDYYLVMDDDNLYVLDEKYIELLKVDRILIHKNSNNYDIIYSEKPMYIKDSYHNGKLSYEYYDLYSYEKIDNILVGGKDE